MNGRIYNVLFLCTGNSARSILAEALLNRMGEGRFRAYSAGSHPKGQVNPDAILLLDRLGYPTGEFRSKSWDEFGLPDAPKMDLIITVCDDAAGEMCPFWPGHPATAHWGIEDPSHAQGDASERARAFEVAHGFLQKRIAALMSLPLGTISEPTLRQRLQEIGRIEGASRQAQMS